MKSIYILLCSLIVFAGCEKKETSELTTVTLTMPDLSVNDANTIYSRSASAPATINDVNCFAVMVEGPEPFLSRTTCTVVNSSGTQVAAVKKTGLIRGLIPSGGVITLSIAAGVDRKFTLLGVKAEPLSACMDFNSMNASTDYTSDLFVVGESSKVELQPGVTVNVPIKLPTSGTAFNTSSSRIGDCTGQDSPFKARITPTKAQIVKDYFPFDTFQYSTCNSVNINFTDDIGRSGATASSYNMILERADVSGTVVGTYAPFAMFTQPGCSGTMTTEFNVPANTRTVPVYLYTGASPSVTGFKFRLKPGTTNPSPYAESISDTFLIAQNSSTASIDYSGARRIVADMCYNLEGTFKTTGMSVISGSAYTVTYPDIEGKVFPNKFCTSTPVVDGATHAITVDSRFDFSIRYTQDVFTQTSFSMTPTVPSTSSTSVARYPIQVVGGSHNPTILHSDLPLSLPATTIGCFGPYQVLIENERGGSLVTEGAIAVSLVSGAPGSVAIFNNNLCNQTYASSFSDDYRRVFYIGVSTTAVVANTTIGIKAAGQIDHPDSRGDATQTTSLTTVVNLPFK
ncbi:hypothetical protein CIK05_14355 [Bdellovibrio sp. qaytius]|nr:hypothetical protein CIK05_14355 [Bdellovibrio sp. qaytius]